MKKWRELGYPAKLYLYFFLFIATVIGLKIVSETRLPGVSKPPYLFLIWNTFLAWIPAILSIILDALSLIKLKATRMISMIFFGIIWLLFYPNAAYLITDMLHPFVRYPTDTSRFWMEIPFWNHLFILFYVALLGLILGIISLVSVHLIVERLYGKIVGWCFAVIVLGLSSFGVYLGRFLRWNSWDVFHRPLYVLEETLTYFLNKPNLLHTLAFCKWMFLITFVSYMLFWLFGKWTGGVGIGKGSKAT